MAEVDSGRSREESRRLAEELEATGIALFGDVGIEMLVKAADIRRDALDDFRGAMVLLRRILKDAPRSHLALSRALPLAEVMSAHEDLAELLMLAARATMRSGPRAQLLVRRADALAVMLGRIAEARGQYREAAKLAPGTALASAAEAAANRIDARLSEERDGRTIDEPLSPVLTEPLRFGDEDTSTSTADTDGALEMLRGRIGARAPLDHTLVMEAVQLGLSRGVDDVAERVLPWMRPVRRASLLEEIASGADGAQDPESALMARAAAFFDAPGEDPYFDAMLEISKARGDDESIARTIERRAQELGADELLPHAAAVKDEKRRARLLIELVRTADDLSTLERAIQEARAIADKIERPRIAARVLAAGASHEWLPIEERASILLDMAALLRDRLDDKEGARVVEREAKAMMGRSRDTQPDRPSPFYSETTVAPDTEETTRSLADEVESLVRSQLPARRPPRSADPVQLVRSGHIDEAIERLAGTEQGVGELIDIARRARNVGKVAGASAVLAAAWARAEEPLRGTVAKEALALADAGAGALAEEVAQCDDLADEDVIRLVAMYGAEKLALPRCAERLKTIFDEDPEDTEVAAALLAYYETTSKHGEADVVIRALTSAQDPRIVCAVARHHERRADVGRAQAILRVALERDPSLVDVATCAFDIACRASDDALVDDALRALRLAWFERGNVTAAYLVAAVLVARSADGAADRLTYDDHRHHVRGMPKSGLPADWATELTDGFDPPEEPPDGRWPPLTLADPALAALDAIRAAFRMPRVTVAASPDGRVLAGVGPTIAIPPALGAYPNRLRFDLARTMAALADQRLVRALEFVQDEDEDPPAAVQALDRAGLILSTDPALALAEVGPRTARGRAMTDYLVSGALGAVWDVMGLGPKRVQRDPSRDPR